MVLVQELDPLTLSSVLFPQAFQSLKSLWRPEGQVLLAWPRWEGVVHTASWLFCRIVQFLSVMVCPVVQQDRNCLPALCGQVWLCTSGSRLRNLSIVLAICAHVPLLMGWLSAFFRMCRYICVCPCLHMSAYMSGSRGPWDFMGVSVHMFLPVQCASVESHGFLNVSACKSRFMHLHL